ncbi:MAG: hypothetical protein KGQ60_11725, partial [Planctomycetes bacterium]|nr:hypothetical protein [Planctomycetota bacterium]
MHCGPAVQDSNLGRSVKNYGDSRILGFEFRGTDTKPKYVSFGEQKWQDPPLREARRLDGLEIGYCRLSKSAGDVILRFTQQRFGEDR